jgi:hypothetical protein
MITDCSLGRRAQNGKAVLVRQRKSRMAPIGGFQLPHILHLMQPILMVDDASYSVL